MERFSNWGQLPVIPLETMDRQIYTGEKAMVVRNSIHPHAVIPPHSHPHEQILYVESGACDVVADGETRHLTAGGLAWFPSGTEHAVTNTEDVPLVAFDIFSPIREDFLK